MGGQGSWPKSFPVQIAARMENGNVFFPAIANQLACRQFPPAAAAESAAHFPSNRPGDL